MIPVIVLGSWLFWTIISVFSVAIIACIENAKGKLSFFLTVGLTAALWKGFSALDWQTIVLWVLGYLAIGLGWSFAKWYRHLKKLRDGRIAEEVSDYAFEEGRKASNHKSEICMWIAFWVWDAFWTVSRDVVKAIYEGFSGVYDRMSKRVLGDLVTTKKK